MQKKINNKRIKPNDLTKYEIAEELGFLERVKQDGWGSLTAKETGKIGGIITKRKRFDKINKNNDEKPST